MGVSDARKPQGTLWRHNQVGVLPRVPRFWVIALLAIAAWGLTISLVVLILHQHAVLLRAASLLANLHISI
jgi:hypothetical protein